MDDAPPISPTVVHAEELERACDTKRDGETTKTVAANTERLYYVFKCKNAADEKNNRITCVPVHHPLPCTTFIVLRVIIAARIYADKM